jgi:hypothetical protein
MVPDFEKCCVGRIGLCSASGPYGISDSAHFRHRRPSTYCIGGLKWRSVANAAQPRRPARVRAGAADHIVKPAG